jgi:hypothetical protein
VRVEDEINAKKIVDIDEVAMFASEDDKLIYQHFLFKGYELAQSKGVYSEAQVRQAYRVNYGPDKEDKYLASIQPKIVVETKYTYPHKHEECRIECICTNDERELVPITFKGEDGRTHFKIK